MKIIQMPKTCFGVALFLVLYSFDFTVAGESWTIRPEMQLPPIPPTTIPAIKTIARFDFENDLEGWRPRHSDVKVEHSTTAADNATGILHVHGREPSNWNFITSPLMQVEPGKKYRAWMRVRIESRPEGNQPVYFKIEFVRPDVKRSRMVSSTRVPPSELQTWCQIQAELQVPTNCSSVWAALEKGTQSPASIDVLIDEFVLEEIAAFSEENILSEGILTGPITKNLKNVHPRIYFNSQKIKDLRAQIKTDPKWASAQKTLFAIANRGVRAGPPDYEKKVEDDKTNGKAGASEQLWQRSVGNMIPHLALAYLLSDDEKYLDSAKAWIFASLSYKTWGLGNTDGMDLATGHQLTGIGLGYDWLYHDLTSEERSKIRKGVKKRANAMAKALFKQRVWWHDKYMQNHQWVNCTGLATAGFAMCDEIDEANGWIRLAHERFLTTLATVGDDGASHEGYGYWEYGAEYIVRYMEMSNDLLGINLYQSGNSDHLWLKNSPLYALYISLPYKTWTNRQSIIDFGDSPRYHWYGPSYLLRNIARRYPESSSSGLSQWLSLQIESANIDSTAGGHYLNFAWYDTEIPQSPPNMLPRLHHFEDMGIVSVRSDWSGNESLLVVKCGPPLGHKNIHASYDYGAGHVHPDAGHFVFFSSGQFLLRDNGYSRNKMTGNHNTLLIDGKGQKGGGKTWFDYSSWLREQKAPRILSATSSPDVDVIICDVAPAYPSELGLKKFIRTFRFYKPDRLIIEDDLEAEIPLVFESRLHVEGTVEEVSANNYRLKQKEVTALITIDEGVNVAIRKNDSGQFLSLTSKKKQLKTRCKVVINVETGKKF